MEKVLNLTQHKATPDQLEAGVIDLPEEERKKLQVHLTFDTLPTAEEIDNHAIEVSVIAELHHDIDNVMIGGAPFFMSTLEEVLKDSGHKVFYAFSKRESVETPTPDGGVTKTMVFKHSGFIQA